jgi:phospholipase/carboxylesterase
MTDSLRTIRRGPDRPTGVLVVLPGYGDRPERFLDRAAHFDPDERWLVVVVEPSLHGEIGPYWYDVGDDGPDPDELAGAIAAVDATLDDLAGSTGIARHEFVMCGFSQGGALALATLLDPSVTAPAAVAAIAAYLPYRDEMELDRAAGRPMLFAHGTADETVELLRGRAAAKALHRAGAVV